MCEFIKENNGKCCGECNEVEYYTCACGALIPKGDEIQCLFCKDYMCDECGYPDWFDMGISICKLDRCKNEAIEYLATKLDAAAYALSVIESITNGPYSFTVKGFAKVHTIAQNAYRAAK